MKRTSSWKAAVYGFSLVELLVVIGILALFASLLLPAFSRIKARSLIRRTSQELSGIVSAIQQYEAAYGRFPVSNEAQRGVSALAEDYTYGSTFFKEDGGRIVIGGPGDYLNNNNEVMAILLDLEYYANGKPTINREHIKNPQRTRFVNAHIAETTNAPGIGPDGAYRDPWGITYMITLDLNHDGRARDFFYRQPAVSADPVKLDRGLQGLVQHTDAKGNGVFEATAPVIAWSPGPDKLINPEKKANAAVNKDNLISWQ